MYYLECAARGSGWEVSREGEDLRITLADHMVQALFWHDGGFRFARCTGAGSSAAELTLPQVVALLQEHGQPSP